MNPLESELEARRRRIESALDEALPRPEGPAATVAEAMRYATLGGGKRLRPVVVLAACEACGGDSDLALPAAVAVELIHGYSLVHDDLPAMDDDDLRRGRPTVHRKFDEATAILAGDALHSLAFHVLTTRPPGPRFASIRADSAATLAEAAGLRGMVGGQVADLDAERTTGGDLDRVRWIHRHKTGALLAASARLGAIAADSSEELRDELERYGHALGLAFQIADDVLDETSSADVLGKTPGKDRRAGKATYPGLIGLDAARDEARACVREAIDALRRVPGPVELLIELARFAAARSS